MSRLNNLVLIPDANNVLKEGKSNCIKAIEQVFGWFLYGTHTSTLFDLQNQINYHEDASTFPEWVAKRLRTVALMLEDPDANKAQLESFRYTVIRLVRNNEKKIISDLRWQLPVSRNTSMILDSKQSKLDHRTRQQELTRSSTTKKDRE